MPQTVAKPEPKSLSIALKTDRRTAAGYYAFSLNGQFPPGMAIHCDTLTCGNSYAYSSTGTVSNATWTTGTGIDPAMAGKLTEISITTMIVEDTR
ncbi:MAG: hypothetical protein WAN12_18175 [Candidatus Acidiferrum sp.]